MIVVADIGPLRYLILIEYVQVLPDLYGRVLVPPAVLTELDQEQTPELVRQLDLGPTPMAGSCSAAAGPCVSAQRARTFVELVEQDAVSTDRPALRHPMGPDRGSASNTRSASLRCSISSMEGDVCPWCKDQIEDFVPRLKDIVDAVLGSVDHLDVLHSTWRSPSHACGSPSTSLCDRGLKLTRIRRPSNRCRTFSQGIISTVLASIPQPGDLRRTTSLVLPAEAGSHTLTSLGEPAEAGPHDRHRVATCAQHSLPAEAGSHTLTSLVSQLKLAPTTDIALRPARSIHRLKPEATPDFAGEPAEAGPHDRHRVATCAAFTSG